MNHPRTLLLAAALALAPAAPLRAEGLERTLPAEPGGTLRVELAVGSVDVESHDEPEVEIDADGAGPGIEFELEQIGDEVRLTGTLASFWGFLGAGDVRVRARVPRAFSVDVETRGGRVAVEEIRGRVEVHTTGGSIDVDRVEGPVRLRTTGGSIDATSIRGAVRAETTGGSIRIEDALGDVEATTTGGSIRVEEARGQVEATTTGGSIRVSWDAPPEGRLRTSGGGIEVEVPEGAGAELDAHATGGRVAIDGELGFGGTSERDAARGRLGPGGATLDLRTTGGGIRLRRR